MDSRVGLRALVGLCCLLLVTRSARGDIDAEQVRLAIERGTKYLIDNQRASGNWPDHLGMETGVTSLCTLALLTAGVPAKDPHIQKSLTALRKAKLEDTYTVALQTMVLSQAEPRQDQLLIKQNVRWLEANQLADGARRGAWNYGRGRGSGDNSNAQFALLALHEAERAGVAVSERTWKLAQEYWLGCQNNDGSWGYLVGAPGTGSMTCAGISALVIAGEKLHRGDVEVRDNGVRCCGEQQPSEALDRALDWLGRNFSVHVNPNMGRSWLYYYLYGVERAGRLTNQRFIGRHDWYRAGAELLVSQQDELSGFWRGTGHAENDPLIGTSLALLFLAKGRRPILMSKLKHQPWDDWNHHRTDLANLTSYAERRWERDLTWQVVDVTRAAVEDLQQAPVLFLSGQAAVQMNDQQVQRLRAYIDRGGFLFAEQCCQGTDFDRSFRALVKRLFPEPGVELRLLSPDHPVWSTEERVDPKFLRPLWGVDVGCRTSVVYCPENLGCYWEAARPGREDRLPAATRDEVEAVRSIGLNVLAYATNRELKFKLAAVPNDAPLATDPVERAKLWVAKVKHSGGWDIAPQALPNLMRAAAREASLRVNIEKRELLLTDPVLFDHHVLFMHGRHSFEFSAAERKSLKLFVERGGLLLADAICGSPEFASAFRREVAVIFKDGLLRAIPPDDPLLTSAYGGFDLRRVTLREAAEQPGPGAQRLIPRQVAPQLEGLRLKDGFGVILSPHDLSCALERHESIECPGYAREDAARIGLNILLYALQQ